MALRFPLASEALGREQVVVLLLGGRMISADLHRDEGVAPVGGVTAPLSISVNPHLEITSLRVWRGTAWGPWQEVGDKP